MKQIDVKQIMNDIRNEIEKEKMRRVSISFPDFKRYSPIIPILQRRHELVVYGIGKIGSRFFSALQPCVNIAAICDNNSVQTELSGCPIYEHKTCVKKFPEATYIVTPQKDFLEIVLNLRKSGLPARNILFYDNRKNRLDGDTSPSIRTDSAFSFLYGNSNVVLYGLGKMGKMVFDRLQSCGDFKLKAICDNGINLDAYQNVPLYAHKKCVSLFPKATYLISPQSGYIQIAMDLLDSGVSSDKIMIYNNAKNIVEKAVK